MTDDDGPPAEPDVREALHSLRSDPEAMIHDVITLWNASYELPLLPTAAGFRDPQLAQM